MRFVNRFNCVEVNALSQFEVQLGSWRRSFDLGQDCRWAL